MSKFTKGPWKVESHSVFALIHDGWRKGEETFKNRFWLSVYGDKDCPKEEIDANAALISAAPEMYEVLKECLNFMSLCTLVEDSDLQTYLKARRALQKAEGK